MKNGKEHPQEIVNRAHALRKQKPRPSYASIASTIYKEFKVSVSPSTITDWVKRNTRKPT